MTSDYEPSERFLNKFQELRGAMRAGFAEAVGPGLEDLAVEQEMSFACDLKNDLVGVAREFGDVGAMYVMDLVLLGLKFQKESGLPPAELKKFQRRAGRMRGL